MLQNAIIIFFVCGAFFRAAREYGKNGFAWAVVGLLAFYLPSYLIPFVVALLLTMFGVGANAVVGSLPLSGILGFVAGVAAVVIVYNRLMDRAINEQAAIDAQTSTPLTSSAPVADKPQPASQD